MILPVANKAVVDARIAMARDKIANFEEKIKKIDLHISTLESEKIAAETTIEYYSRTEKRRSLLLGLFVFDGEYGETESLPDWHKHQLAEHAQAMSDSIKHYQRCKEKRSKGISFLKKDIEMLEIIRSARYRHPLIRNALIDP